MKLISEQQRPSYVAKNAHYVAEMFMNGNKKSIHIKADEFSSTRSNKASMISECVAIIWAELKLLALDQFVGEIIVSRWTWDEYTFIKDSLSTLDDVKAIIKKSIQN